MVSLLGGSAILSFTNAYASSRCPLGQRYSCLPVIDSLLITNTDALARVAKPQDGSTDNVSGTNVTTATYGLTEPGEWAVSFMHGDIRGISKCSSTEMPEDYAPGNPSDTLGATCWCQPTGFRPTENNTFWCNSATGPWIAYKTYDSSSACQHSCPEYCGHINPISGTVAGKNSSFWSSLVDYPDDICVNSSFVINYDLNDGHFIEGSVIPRIYEEADTTINIPNPARAGYTFDGWCDSYDSQSGAYTGCEINKQFNPATTETQNPTFYAKWSFASCPAGYPLAPENATKVEDCYQIYHCPTTCPPHAHNCENVGPETITIHYPSAPHRVNFESVCNMDIECDAGYELKLRKNVGHEENTTPPFNYSGIQKTLTGQVYQRVENITDAFSILYNSQPNLLGDASWLENGQYEWNMDYGTVRYESTCDTASYTDGTINGEPGKTCWCKMTQYSADGTNFIDMDIPWYSSGSQHPNRADCLESCSCYPFWSGLNLFWFGEDKVCAAKPYFIHFNPRGGYMDLIGNSVNDYYTAYDITAEPFYLPKPSRPRYAFAGWCETLADAENDNANCSVNVLVTPSGSDPAEKWYYAKWTPVVCDEDKVVATDFDTTKDMLNYSSIETDGEFRANTFTPRGVSPENYNLAQSGTWAAEYDYGTIYGEAVCKDADYWKGYFNSTLVPDEVLNTFPDIYDATNYDDRAGTCFCKITGFKSKFANTLQPISGSWRTLFGAGAYGCKISCAYGCATGAKKLFAENANTNYCAYKISYNLSNDAFFPAGTLHPNTYKSGDSFTITVAPARDGYTFNGWCQDSSNCANPQDSFAITSAMVGAVDLYPQWTAKQYTITYNTMGGTPTCSSTTYTVGDTVSLPGGDLTREGYTFAGWCVDNETCTNPIASTFTGTTRDVTLYAQWVENVVIPDEPDTEQEPTPVAEPDECALASCVVTINFGNGQTTEETFGNGDDLVMPVQAEPTGSVFNGYCEGTPTCTEPQMRLTTEQIENGATMYPQYIPVSTETAVPSVAERTCLNDACEIVLNNDDSTESSANINLNSGSNPRSASALRRGGTSNSSATGRSARTFNRGELLITPMLSKPGYTLAGYCIGETDTCSAPIAAVSNINLNTKSRVTITPKWNRSGSSPVDPECTSKAWLHVGNTKACLSTTRFEKPVLGIKTKKGTYYLKASTDSALPMSKNTNRKLRIDNDGVIYNIHDGLVSE